MKAFAASIGRRALGLILFETVLIMVAVCVGAAIRLGIHDAWELLYVHGDIRKALLIALVTQLCLYFADLYDFRVITDRRELFVRAVQALGATSLILAGLYFWLRR